MTPTYTNMSPLIGSYSVDLCSPTGVPITDLINPGTITDTNNVWAYTKLSYTRAINGAWAHGWGMYSISTPINTVPFDSIITDTIVHIKRLAPGSTWKTDFTGVHRRFNISNEGDMLMYTTEGFDLKNLMKRRVTLPDDGSVPNPLGWYFLTNNYGSVYGIIPKQFTTPPTWRPRYYSATCYPEAFDGRFATHTTTITIAGKHGSVMETQRYLYIGCTGIISKIRFTFEVVNSTTAATLWVQYFSAAGWITLAGATDGTVVAGRPMAQNGMYEFTPPADWIKGSGISDAGFDSIYWLRFCLNEDGDTTNVQFQLQEVEVYGIPEVDTLRWSSGTDHWTDIMRHLVRDQCITGSLAAGRQILGLTCEADTHEGLDEDGNQINLCYRYDNVANVLEEISGIGADWDVVETGPGAYQFRVYYEMSGNDLTEDNLVGNTPVTFSLENQNIETINYIKDRSSEVTVCYGVGKLINGVRLIVERKSLYGADTDSVWNRIEATADATTQDTEAAQIIAADGFLADNMLKLEVSFVAKQTPTCLYGVDWDLGDLVGFYFNETYYKMRVTQVTVDVSSSGEVITPTIVELPSMGYLY